MHPRGPVITALTCLSSWARAATQSSSQSSHSPHPPSQSYGNQHGEPTVTIDAGVIIGTTTAIASATATVNQYLGVPFAQSPPERFSPPQPAPPYGSPLTAQQRKPACIQQFQYPLASVEFKKHVFSDPLPEESEDCLYLNVFAPSTPAPPDGRAVMYWIFGGSLQFGNGGQPIYDGSYLAVSEDVIVVTVNYRTNVFGFPTTPELPLDGHNLGFLDQRAGLQWVQDNIAAFGGSPAKVTIFGESAGAWSVDALLTSYPAHSDPPFRAAILQSGQVSYSAYPRPHLPSAWASLSAALHCPGSHATDLACVRAAPATEIQHIIDEQRLTFNPIPDNITLVPNPAARRLSGEIAHVPVLAGSNSQEGSVFTLGQNDTNAFLTNILGLGTDAIAAVEAAYAIGSPGIESAHDQINAIFTEGVFSCSEAAWAHASASIGIPTWRYLFNASFPNTQPYPNLGAYHSSEIYLAFGTYPKDDATTQEVALSTAMMSAWGRFAKNPMDGPGWDSVRTGEAGQVLFGTNDYDVGGWYAGSQGNALNGSKDLALLGNTGSEAGNGVTLIAQQEVDYRCGLWTPVYEAVGELFNGL